MAAFAGLGKELLIQLERLQGSQPLQGLHLASARCAEEKKKSEAETNERKTMMIERM